MRAVPLLRPLVASCAALVLLAGCAVSPGGPPTIDRYKPVLRMAVSLATERLLRENPDLIPLTFQVSAILVDTFDGEDFTSLNMVREYVRVHIPWERVGQDARPLIEALLLGIAAELRYQIEQHQIPETQVVILVKEMLQWVHEDANRLMVQPVKVPRLGRP